MNRFDKKIQNSQRYALAVLYGRIFDMIKGIDYTGVTVSFRCHDGAGNYVMHKRGVLCRDEHGRWDFGGGGVKFGEALEDALRREVMEEYSVPIISFEYLGHKELHRVHDGKPTHWISFRYKVLVDRDKVVNGEPEKHEEIGWFSLDALPSPLHSMIESELEQLQK